MFVWSVRLGLHLDAPIGSPFSYVNVMLHATSYYSVIFALIGLFHYSPREIVDPSNATVETRLSGGSPLLPATLLFHLFQMALYTNLQYNLIND